MQRPLPLILSALVSFAAVGLAACAPKDAANAAVPAGASAPTATVASSGATLSDTISERADRGRIMGDSAAPVWFIIASDFQCPYCKQWHDDSFGPLVRDYVATGKIRVAYVNFPLSMHKNAVPSAEAAMCAAVQGKFWQMHDAIFGSQEQWSGSDNPEPLFESLATRIGLSMPAWRQCVEKHLTVPLIQADHDRIAAAKINSTPNFFVGDQLVAGVRPYAELRPIIDAEVAKARASQPKRPEL